MSKLNDQQKKIAETLDGIIVVDAGPGTGKTHTIVQRYVNILKKDNIDTKDILLLTFTKNAADEMEGRIKNTLSDEKMDSKFLQTGTFDSFCLSIVLDSPESVSRFFGIDEKLTRGAKLTVNETLNKDYFSNLFDRFMDSYGDDYGFHSTVATQCVDDMYDIINRLMSRGIMPLKKGWFGGDDGKVLIGDTDALEAELIDWNNETVGSDSPRSKLTKEFLDGYVDEDYSLSFDIDKNDPLPYEMVEASIYDDRSMMISLIHDLYFEYIRRSIIDNRLTFGLTAAFAFAVLYTDRGVRERRSCKYLMIDEFQDTNSNQLMIALMLMKEPNLCVVGDWKQGIYGFRYVSIENIIDFERRANALKKLLNDDAERVLFNIPSPIEIPLIENYRSSQLIIDTAFKCLYLPASKNDDVKEDYLNEHVTKITAMRDEIGDDTAVTFVHTVTRDEEIQEVLRRIEDYVNGDYMIHARKDDEPPRKARYDDIAVLCSTTKMCRAIYEAAYKAGIPAFLQGDIEIMSTREGKLALAWMRYANNDSDLWALCTILADKNYPLARIRSMLNGKNTSDDWNIPQDILDLRKSLRKKRRRITDFLTTVFAEYGLNNDITQTIISVLSSSHRDSLITISDLIRMMETDIKKGTRYTIDGSLDTKAVTIQTMHKSKGLEYPIVIIAGMDKGLLPMSKPDLSTYKFTDLTGVRCMKEISEYGDNNVRICKSWRSRLSRTTLIHDYSEDRRLLFVAASRAEQYLTFVSGGESSRFYDGLVNEEDDALGNGEVISSYLKESKELAPRPVIKEFEKRRANIGVHDILHFNDDAMPEEGSDEFSGKGMKYGTDVHEAAFAIAIGRQPVKDYPEIPAIKRVLENTSSGKQYPEVECSLPFNEYKATLRGIIDLLVVYPDRIEIHDYKTDVSRMYEEEYKMQLSVYAHAASEFYKLPTVCVIDYISQDIEPVVFEPFAKDLIEERVKEYMGSK